MKHLPNILTISRVFFTLGFLILLATADVEQLTPSDVWQLDMAFVLFLISSLTDILDGHLARSLKATSRFGRVFDPLADKFQSIGGFVLLAWIGKDITAVAWWMVAIIAAREIIVTLARHVSEAQGQSFAATWAGKLKMFLQSFAIGTLLVYLAHFQQAGWAIVLRNLTVWLAVLVTAVSIILYLPRIRNIFKKK